jgi:rhodanese-related sulfurtransferase
MIRDTIVGVGVIGAGTWARSAHLPGYARDPRCRVVAVCDVEIDRARDAARAFDVPTATADAEEILRRDDVDLVDVRDEAEWVEGHVSGSQHIPLEHLRSGRVELANHGRTTAVACAAGNRAAFAASLLRRAGHANIVRISGGGVADLGEREREE